MPPKSAILRMSRVRVLTSNAMPMNTTGLHVDHEPHDDTWHEVGPVDMGVGGIVGALVGACVGAGG